MAAADAFVVVPGSRLEETRQARASGDQIRTVIAGYHWFGDWGRDTMISLPGLLITPGRLEEARSIIEGFLAFRKDGIIPNRFPDAGEQPEYNTADGTLWIFQAVRAWLAAGGVVVHWQNGGAFARSLPKDFSTALAIFTDATTYWAGQDRIMVVLLDENSRNGRALPSLLS